MISWLRVFMCGPYYHDEVSADWDTKAKHASVLWAAASVVPGRGEAYPPVRKSGAREAGNFL